MILFLSLFSCMEEENEDATINYFLTTTGTTEFKQVLLQFGHTRAHQQQPNQNRTIVTVYLDPKQVEFDLSKPEPVFLGASEIGPKEIIGYDFGLWNFKLIGEKDTLDLAQSFYHDDYSSFPFEPTMGEELNVTFVLDLDASLVLDSAGQNWIKPRILIQPNR